MGSAWGSCCIPAAQIRHAAHVAAAEDNAKVLVGHCTQLAAPTLDLFVPGEHAVHAPPFGPCAKVARQLTQRQREVAR